jgi:NAD(P)-dependent dehydrogenase (short-subunit alcohol dehydrogenase family)
MKKFEDLFSVRNKVVIITGGAGVLGAEYANFLKSAGARVVIFDIKSGASLQKQKNLDYFQLDLSDRVAVFSAVKNVTQKYGKIDVIINNAAMDAVPGNDASLDQFSPYENYPQALWEREFSVGLSSALFCLQAIVPVMKMQGYGSIINISSTYGNVGPDNRIYDDGKYKSIAYVTSKGAILNFTRAWATYLRGTNIRVNTLTLGGVKAGQSQEFIKAYEERTIIGTMANKEDYNGAILFLASNASNYMTGSNLIVDGGWTAW